MIEKNTYIAFFSAILFFVACIDIVQVQGIRVLLLPSFMVVVVLMIFGYIKNVPKRDVLFLYIYLAFSSISILYSFNVSRSFIYWLWPFFNFISLFLPFYILARLDSNRTFQGVIFACRFTCIIGILLWLLGYHDRLQALFYESSYFSIALSIYFINFLYKFEFSIKKHILFDTTLVVLCLIGSKSAMLLAVIILGFIFKALVSFKSYIQLLKTLLIFIISILTSFYYVSNNNDLLSRSLYLFYQSMESPDLLVDRAGNRFPRFVLATEVIVNNPLGVGVGTYISHIDNVSYPSSYNLPEWLDPSSKPAINIYMEIAATSGWISALIFIVWQLMTIIKSRKIDENELVVLISFIIMIIILQAESNYLRPYFWCVWGFLAALSKDRNKV